MGEPLIFSLDSYIVRQKVLSLRATYFILSPDGSELGKAVRNLGFTPKIEIFDSMGALVGRLVGRALSFRGDFRFYDWAGRYVGVLKRKFKLLGSEYWFEDARGARIYRVVGRFTAHDYRILDYRTGRVLARIGKEWLSLSDKYGIRILDKRSLHPFIALGITLVIDTIEHQ